jgi:hypothetical protein
LTAAQVENARGALQQAAFEERAKKRIVGELAAREKIREEPWPGFEIGSGGAVQ